MSAVPKDDVVGLDIEALYFEGVRAHMAEHDAGEVDKVGTFRAGNSGLFLSQDKVAGACHRLTMARYLGVPVPRDEVAIEDWENRQLMFELGHANEDIWAAALTASPAFQAAGYKLLREEEIQLSRVIPHGGKELTVSGRPDMIVMDSKDQPVEGIELKQVSSLWTGRDVFFASKPKLDHLVQAASYMWMLSTRYGRVVPYSLRYTSRVDFAVPPFFKKNKKGGWDVKQDETFEALTVAYKARRMHPHLRYVEFSWDGKVKKTKQFLTSYRLRFTPEGKLQYMHLQPADLKPKWADTIITKDALDDYYRYVADTAGLRDLGVRPATLDADGSRAGFSKCDYCDVKPICDSHEGDFEGWLRAMRDSLPGAQRAKLSDSTKK